MYQSQVDQLGEAGWPLTVCVEPKQLPLTLGENQECPRRGDGRSTETPGQPAPLLSHWCSLLVWKLSTTALYLLATDAKPRTDPEAL